MTTEHSQGKQKRGLIALVLALSTVVSVLFLMYGMKQKEQAEEWKKKYEEALIDMEEAYKRLEEQDAQLRAALEEARQHSLKLETMAEELKGNKK